MNSKRNVSEKNESREDKFKRLAELRVNNTLSKIAIIGNLASNNYAFTSEQVEKIIDEKLGTHNEEMHEE